MQLLSSVKYRRALLLAHGAWGSLKHGNQIILCVHMHAVKSEICIHTQRVSQFLFAVFSLHTAHTALLHLQCAEICILIHFFSKFLKYLNLIIDHRSWQYVGNTQCTFWISNSGRTVRSWSIHASEVSSSTNTHVDIAGWENVKLPFTSSANTVNLLGAVSHQDLKKMALRSFEAATGDFHFSLSPARKRSLK